VTPVLSTARLQLREIEDTDAAFLLQLLNTRDFINNIGDRRVRSIDDSRRYIENNIRASYRQHGMGLWVVEDRNSRAMLGLCGLLKRDTLEHPDVGYAFLPSAFGCGFATEAAAACLHHGRSALGLLSICAIVGAHNQASIRVLEKIGLHYQREIPGTEPGQMLQLFV
jgi:[ribosomal protein S5]-alanine N-acetyltransferase